ncbi:MAG: helix-turn-helix domain-containing protein [Deltaproteobacteria bacterium]|nr:helix-turn-helix domain-containing protein [Deltaproteobacteria bacterium]
MSNTPPVLSVRDIAARWKCSRQSVLDRIHSGEIKAFKIGRRHLVPIQELERFERCEPR